MSPFEIALEGLPDPPVLPKNLFLTHLSIAKWFESIVDTGSLIPRTCKVFGEELLYLFYGGVFYRPADGPTRSPLELPIAMVFHPSVVRQMSRLYPFDTGAMASGRFGPWSSEFVGFKEDFRATIADHMTPPKIVHHLFGGNDNYRRYRPTPDCTLKPAPLPRLYEFYRSDLQVMGCDHRQCVLECQTDTALQLDSTLLWIGFPDHLMPEYERLCEKLRPHIPFPQTYPTREIHHPRETAMALQTEAEKHFSHLFRSPA